MGGAWVHACGPGGVAQLQRRRWAKCQLSLRKHPCDSFPAEHPHVLQSTTAARLVPMGLRALRGGCPPAAGSSAAASSAHASVASVGDGMLPTDVCRAARQLMPSMCRGGLCRKGPCSLASRVCKGRVASGRRRPAGAGLGHPTWPSPAPCSPPRTRLMSACRLEHTGAGNAAAARWRTLAATAASGAAGRSRDDGQPLLSGEAGAARRPRKRLSDGTLAWQTAGGGHGIVVAEQSMRQGAQRRLYLPLKKSGQCSGVQLTPLTALLKASVASAAR